MPHPPGQTPLWADTPLHSSCWDIVNKQVVCILLECILVFSAYTRMNSTRCSGHVSFHACPPAIHAPPPPPHVRPCHVCPLLPHMSLTMHASPAMHAPTPVDRMIDTCEKITFPQLLLRAVNMFLFTHLTQIITSDQIDSLVSYLYHGRYPFNSPRHNQALFAWCYSQQRSISASSLPSPQSLSPSQTQRS